MVHTYASVDFMCYSPVQYNIPQAISVLIGDISWYICNSSNYASSHWLTVKIGQVCVHFMQQSTIYSKGEKRLYPSLHIIKMGRKIEMKKIEETTKRQITFSKRRSNLMKKAEEIVVCCDIDVLFVAFSPSGRISIFCSQKSIEDMLRHYINLSVERRLTHIADVQKKLEKLRQLNHINGDVSKLHFLEKQFVSLFILSLVFFFFL
ncbi:agamous-like MADS-box protein AGL15 [Lycium ferocissimum]|uniref:agamous-like MADS-box protein AGL15 n=1 Tax=Lycium ferocissimum TaxID=112874 RepID=UPI002815296A|nr:agamous-like MADS-box protein AGL15 [Lycium ferocissimum]